jgi:predicted transcriptional regulator
MKPKEELKKELHLLIDSIEDELTPEQQMELDEAIRQADAGEVVSWDEYMEATKRWHTN